MTETVSSDDIPFDRHFEERPGHLGVLSPLVRRMLCANPGPFTFKGTCTYVVGHGTVAIIDPGPDDANHISALLAALDGETVSHIVVTHTHRDHSPAAAALKAATGARIVGCGAHRPSRRLALGEVNPLDASADQTFAPDLQMEQGDAIDGPGWSLSAIETPGHTANHLAFALREENALFSADHVMAWSTTIVAPPDGSMADYMASLEKLRGAEHAIYWPGHGGPVREPERFLRALVHHRRQREASILNRLRAGDTQIRQIVAAIYEGIDSRLHGAAALSVYAQLEDLVARQTVVADEGLVTLDGAYRLT
jgi:glyoxylase-like metal-dependent hydrolase (beta-lactamase superfamily II)